VKHSEITRRLHQTYAKIDTQREPVCSGCGRGDKPLSHSHTISKNDAKGLGKPELIWDADNIELECFYGREGCHDKWESDSIMVKATLLNFDRKMAYLRLHNPGRYNSFVIELNEKDMNSWGYELEDL